MVDYFVMIVSGDSVSDDSVNYHTVRTISHKKIKFKDLKDLKDGKVLKKSEIVKKIEENSKKNVQNRDFYEGCESTKVCFGMPSGCVSDNDCKSVISVGKSGKIC